MKTDKITCVECGYLNEPERVYCHNCGAKLDHSLLPAKAKKKQATKVDPKKLKQKLKVRTPVFKPLAICLLVSLFLATLILALQAPGNAPELDPEPLLNTPDIGGDLINLTTATSNTFVSYTEEQANSYIKSAIRTSNKKKGPSTFAYVGSYVAFDDGLITLMMVESVYGYPIYIHISIKPESTSEGIKATTVSCGFGRLKLPAFAIPVTDLFMGKLWKAGERDIENLGKVTDIKVEPDLITLAYSR